jgi:mono/diheme cytochrome c family protein
MGLRPWILGVLAGGLLIGLGVAAYQMGIDEGEERALREGTNAAEPAPAPEPAPASGPGKDLFVSSCGSCHTLAAAGTDGQIGPNLDELEPDAALVLSAIENGGTGSGQMPANLVQGAEADQVAEFVATAAGR